MFGRGFELVDTNGKRCELNKPWPADDTALLADSQNRLYRLASEFDAVCARRKMRVIIGKRCVPEVRGERL